MRKLKFWAILNEQHSGLRYIEEEIQLFEKETKIKVDLVEFSWGKIWGNIINSIKEDEKPDVVQIGNSWTGILSEIGFLDDITNLFFETKCDQLTYNISPEINKKYFSIPWILDLSLLFVRNNDKFDTSKIHTINDLISLSKKLNQRTVLIGGNRDTILLQYISSFIWSYGGDYFRNNKIDILSPKSIEGIKAFFNLIHQFGNKSFLLDIYGNIMWEFFLRNNGLFTFANAWVINAFIKPNKKEKEFTGQFFRVLRTINIHLKVVVV